MQYKYLKFKYLKKYIWTYREKASGQYTELHNEETDLNTDPLVLLTEAKSRRLRCVGNKAEWERETCYKVAVRRINTEMLP
jgi:hypothetical protein